MILTKQDHYEKFDWSPAVNAVYANCSCIVNGEKCMASAIVAVMNKGVNVSLRIYKDCELIFNSFASGVDFKQMSEKVLCSNTNSYIEAIFHLFDQIAQDCYMIYTGTTSLLYPPNLKDEVELK